MNPRTALALGWTAVALFSPAAGQTVLHVYAETEPKARAGDSVAIWDDIDGDGFREWAVGVPRRDGVGIDSGQVLVFSGLDHSLLTTIDGSTAGARLGKSIANVGDLNQDGREELAVGAPGERKVHVHSGTDGARLWTAYEPGDADFGMCVSPAGDANADGVPDIAASAMGVSVIVYSGATGARVYRRAVSWNVGWSMDAIGDVDGDGSDDLLVGAGAFFGGSADDARIFSGPTGATIRTHSSPYGYFMASQFGWDVAGIGDQDGDDVGDYAIGDPTDNSFGGGEGYVAVYSGASGALLTILSPGVWNEFGSAVSNAGDVDADGYDDLVIGNAIGRELFVYSAKRKVKIYGHTHPLDYLGASAAGGRDVTGDGWPEAVVGAEAITFGGGSEDGGAVLITLGCPPDAVYNYCTALPNSTGHPARMHWQGSTSIAADNFRLWAEHCPPNQFGLFFFGRKPSELPWGDGHLCVTGGLHRLPVVNTGSSGQPSQLLDFPSLSQISAGDTWFFSFWFRDPPGGPAGFNFADGLRATFCP